MHKYILTIDQGNTNTTFSLFQEDGQYLSSFSDKDLSQKIDFYCLKDSNTRAILSSVKKEEISLPFKTINIQEKFESNFFLDMPVNYTHTLGVDRLVLAYPLFKKGDTCVCIDSGTFTTVDFISPNGFEGGFILPGLELLAKSYDRGFNLTQAQLKNLNHHSTKMKIPNTTEQAIEQGAMISFLSPIKDILYSTSSYTKVLVTGGNAHWLKKLDRNVTIDKKLMHKSLFFISKELL